jgi:hypothetical protein
VFIPFFLIGVGGIGLDIIFIKDSGDVTPLALIVNGLTLLILFSVAITLKVRRQKQEGAIPNEYLKTSADTNGKDEEKPKRWRGHILEFAGNMFRYPFVVFFGIIGASAVFAETNGLNDVATSFIFAALCAIVPFGVGVMIWGAFLSDPEVRRPEEPVKREDRWETLLYEMVLGPFNRTNALFILSPLVLGVFILFLFA